MCALAHTHTPHMPPRGLSGGRPRAQRANETAAAKPNKRPADQVAFNQIKPDRYFARGRRGSRGLVSEQESESESERDRARLGRQIQVAREGRN